MRRVACITISLLLPSTLANAPASLRGAAPAPTGSNQTQHQEGAGSINATAHQNITRPFQYYKWYTADSGPGLYPQYLTDDGQGGLSMTIKPGEECVRLTSNQWFTSGRLEVRVKSASIMPGIVTSVYFASGDGRTDDSSTGQQDEIDIEWLGNRPNKIQTNVFYTGIENPRTTDIGVDSSRTERSYGIDFTSRTVTFSLDGAYVRSVQLQRPLKPMRLQMSIWTTTNGWPGVIKWAGDMDWSRNNWQPVTAYMRIMSLPAIAQNSMGIDDDA